MVNSDRLDLVVAQEPCYPGVVGTLSPLVMELSPADSVLLPVAYLAVGHLGECDAVGSSPARVNLEIGGDRHTHFHLKGLLAQMRQPPAAAASPRYRSNHVQHARHITLTSHPTCGTAGGAGGYALAG